MSQRTYKDLIFTDHALERMQEREVKAGDVWATMNRPQVSREAHRQGNWVFTRDWGSEELEVVATKKEGGKWLVISVWSKPISHESDSDGEGFLRRFARILLGK